MAFRTLIKLVVLLLIIIAATCWTAFKNSSLPTHTYKIGVIQTIEHPALDKTRQGTLDELNSQGFRDNLQWSWESAQMNQALAAQIAQKFIGQQVDLIIALGTPASQAALNAARTTNTPVIFTSVTDPKTANLTGNIAGISNFVTVEDQFNLISQILPDKKRIGIIYNPGDANSAILVVKTEKIAAQRGLEVVLATVSKTSEVPAAAQSLMGKVDAIFINNDNTALAAFDGIARVCREGKIPLFASDADVLEKGALAVRGPDQYELGRQTGRMVAKILRGEVKAEDLGTEYPEKVGVYLNRKTATELGITFPEAVKKQQVTQGIALSSTSKLPLVTITQIVQHDALDREREGLIEALKDFGFEDGKTVRIVYENAQGNIATATQIAAKFASQNPDVAVGISTPSAQALIQPMSKHDIPVVFSAVTDPLSAKLVSSLTNHPENVTGVSDGLPLRSQLELIQQFIPAAKTIGVIYNPGEANSASSIKQLQDVAKDMGFAPLVLATTTKTADTIAAAQSLVGKVDAVFIPNDNTVMASITALVALGRSHHLPFFNPDYDAVERGILAVRASSHHKMGYKAGQLIAKILKGAKAADLPVETMHGLDLAINVTTAKALGITIPEDIKQGAKLVP
jgi:putative ABC transport system substrate-binding protein